jgi:hypothetical protein
MITIPLAFFLVSAGLLLTVKALRELTEWLNRKP